MEKKFLDKQGLAELNRSFKDEFVSKGDVPTKVSQLENDKNYVDITKVNELILQASGLKKEVHDSLPTSGKDNVLYLVKDSKGKGNNIYLEYLWIDNKFELIGSTDVDLSQYVKKEELESKLDKSQMSDDIYTDDNNKVASSKAVNTVRTTLENKMYKQEESLYNGVNSSLKNFEGMLTENSKALNAKIENISVPTKLSELTEDSTHRTVTDDEKAKWNNKVDKIDGKALSTNDYTNAEKQKLTGIEAGANKYVHPSTHSADIITETASKKFISSDLKASLESLTIKDTPSTDFDSVSKLGIYNGIFSSNYPTGRGRYTLFVFPTNIRTPSPEDYMFQIAVKDCTRDTPYFRLRRGSHDWTRWYKYSTNDYTDIEKEKVRNIPDNPKYTDTIPDLSGYAKKTDVKSSLSEMTSDSTHRTVTDSEKSTWNNKVDKVSGKALSSNDYTDVDKTKLQTMPVPVFLEKEQYASLSEQEKIDNNKIYYIYAGK